VFSTASAYHQNFHEDGSIGLELESDGRGLFSGRSVQKL
jgi:hypothetical protein